MIIRKGQIINVTHGEHDDYCLISNIRALIKFDIGGCLDTYRSELKTYVVDYNQAYSFVKWLEDKKLVTVLNRDEIDEFNIS